MNAPPDIALDVDSVLAIHRHEDGNIAIGKKLPDGGWNWLWMLTPSMLRGTFKAFQDFLMDGGHFSTQAYWRTAPEGWTGPGGLPAVGVDKHRQVGERRFGRVTENLRWLNCLSLDIDCNRSEHEAKNELEKVPWRDAQRRLEDLQDAGIIPAISMYGYSGRGLYAVWLLHDDHDREHSAPAYHHDVVTWKALQRELIRRTEAAPLPVDHAGSLITQVYKIGGTIHPKTGNAAKYFITAQADKNRRLISYSLSDMAAALGIRSLDIDLPEATRKLADPSRRRKAPKTRNPKKAEGYKKRHALIAQDMLTLLSHRLQDGSGGWQRKNQPYADGHRTPIYGRQRILTLYAQTLLRSMYSPRELLPPATIDTERRLDILSRLRDMAAKCRTPWPDEPKDGGAKAFDIILDGILREYKPGTDGKQRLPPTPKTKTLMEAFGITAELAAEIGLQTIIPESLRAEREAATPTQAAIIQARREWLHDYILKHGGDWTGPRVMRLSAFSPFSWNNHFTATQDLNAIGYRVRSPGRPRKERKK